MTAAVNPIRDTIFGGNNQLYHQVGQFFTIGSSFIIPIGQTGSVAKGLFQFGVGEVGAHFGGTMGYQGAKLFGLSDSDANTVRFLGSIAGGYAGSTVAGKFSLNGPSQKVPRRVTRLDDDFSARLNYKNHPKAYIDGDGNLVPANPNGDASTVSHIRGGNSKNSPYISTTDPSIAGGSKNYGTQQISIKLRKLQRDIDAGRLKNVGIVTHDDLVAQFKNRLQQARMRYANNPSESNLIALNRANSDLQNVIRDGEFLLKGIISKKYILK